MSEAKDYLKKIKWYDALIESKHEEKARLNDLATRITSGMSGVGSAGGGNGDKIGDNAAKIVDMEREIDRIIAESLY